MIFEKPMHWRRGDPGEHMLQMSADEIPYGDRVQLLRSLDNPALKEGRDAHQRCPCLPEMGVQAGQREGRLAGMFRPCPTEDINHGRLVIASRRASGLAKRTNRLHQL